MRDWKWKWKWKKALARLLTAAMVCALVPVTAVHAAYEALAEPADVIRTDKTFLKFGGPSGNLALVNVRGDVYSPNTEDGMYVLEYKESGIEATYKEGYSLPGNGFSSGGFAVVKNDTGDYGIMDNTGAMTVPFGKYQFISEDVSSDGYICVRQGPTRYMLNLLEGTQKEYVEVNSTEYNNWKEWDFCGSGLRCLQYMDSAYQRRYSFLNVDGSKVFSTEYEFATPFNYGYAVVKTVGSQVYDIIDSAGATVSYVPSLSVTGFPFTPVGDNGMVAFMNKDGKYGFANLKGEVVIAPQYDWADNFRNGYAGVETDAGFGLIDTKGNAVIPFGLYQNFSEASETGLVWVRDWDGKIGVVKVTPGAAELKADLMLPFATQYVPYTADLNALALEQQLVTDAVYFQYGPGGSKPPDKLRLSEDGLTLGGAPLAAGEYLFQLKANKVYGTAADTQVLTVGLSVYPNSDKNVNAESDEGYEIESPKPVLYADNLRDHTFVSVGEFAQFQDAYMDGEVLMEGTDYTAEAGSTKITVRAQTFSGLDAGDHTFAATFKDGDGKTKVAAQNFPIGEKTPTYSGGGGGGGSSSYRLNIPSFDHGKVTCNPVRASRGQKVTLTVTPDAGYQLDSISVTQSNGKEVELTQEDGKYIFKMPSGRVDIKAAFSPVSQPSETGRPAGSFSDVPADAWFAQAVEWVSQHGYMVGYGDGTFAPEGEIDAGALSVILAKLAGADLSQYEGIQNADIPEGQWYTAAASWAKASGLLPDGTFRAEGATSRGDMAVTLVRYLRLLGVECAVPETPAAFVDAGEMTAEQNEAFQILYGKGVLSGMGNGVMGASSTTTRAQMAALVRTVYNCLTEEKP